MIKKRGVSPVIATVLLIMLTITAVAILANFVTKFVKTGLPKTTECVPYRNYFEFQEEFVVAGTTHKYNCYNSDEYHISIKARSTDEKLNESIKGFEIVFTDDEGKTSVAKVYNGETSTEVKMYGGIYEGMLSVPSMGGAKTYSYITDKTFKTAEVYPVLKNNRLCEKSDSIELKACEK